MRTKTTLYSLLAICAIAISIAFTPYHSKKIIVIDAGHGGKDLGATLGLFSEKKIVEAIATKIKSLNKNENIEIVLTRSDDQFIELSDRVSAINKINADLVISLHVNKATEIDKSGPCVFVSKKNPFYQKSFEMANAVLTNFSAKDKLMHSNFTILNKTNCAAITLEVGYISNEKDRNYLLSEAGQTETAINILKSIN